MKMINLVIMYTTTHLSMDEQGIVSVFMHSVDCQLKLGWQCWFFLLCFLLV